jgi:hypothetical protein
MLKAALESFELLADEVCFVADIVEGWHRLLNGMIKQGQEANLTIYRC